ncbi:hypothetical protein Hanom_Chr02g00172411 [Helianthus anomalus]
MSISLFLSEGKTFVVMWVPQQRISTSNRNRPRSDEMVLSGSILSIDVFNTTTNSRSWLRTIRIGDFNSHRSIHIRNSNITTLTNDLSAPESKSTL